MAAGRRSVGWAILGLLVATSAAADTATDRFNETIFKQWPVIRSGIVASLQPQLAALSAPGRTVGIRKVSGVTIDLKDAPRVDRLDRSLFQISLPGAGGAWSVRLQATAYLNIRFGWFRFSHSAPVVLEATRIQAQLGLSMQTGANGNPQVSSIDPKVRFRVKVRSSDPIFGLAGRGLTWVLERVLRGPFFLIVSGVLRGHLLPYLQGEPRPWGTGGPGVTNPGPQPMALRADEIHRVIRRDMLPWNTILPVKYSSPNPGQGSVVRTVQHGDSAIWTGHYIAAESFRYRTNRNPKALSGALVGLQGIDDLFAVTGGRGVLARALAPATTLEARQLLASGRPVHRTKIRGVDMIGWGKDFISRDQNVGVMLGMAMADLTFTDPRVRALVKKNASLQVGYMLANNWIVYTPGTKMSTTFLTRFEQQLALLALARRVDPGRFQTAFDHHAPKARLIWFPLWTETFDVHESYYKFNLDHLSLLTVMMLDPHPARFREYHRGLRILRNAIGHHQNAWFDAVTMVVDPTTRSRLGTQVRDELRRWMLRPKRAVTLNPSALAQIPTGLYRVPGESPIRIARHPVPIELRPPTDFLWQRNPWNVKAWSDPTLRQCGVDFVLPYWIGRSLGAY